MPRGGAKAHVLGRVGMLGIAAVPGRVSLVHAIMGVGIGVSGAVAVLAVPARERLYQLRACRHRHHPQRSTHRHGVAQQTPKDQKRYQKKGQTAAHGMDDTGAVG